MQGNGPEQPKRAKSQHSLQLDFNVGFGKNQTVREEFTASAVIPENPRKLMVGSTNTSF
jgi:hypothetical protein